MCGIFGYKGTSNATKKVLDGLKRLEYRGYDSWGIAIHAGSMIHLAKKAGKIVDITYSNLGLADSSIAIGHTRWATTGAVSDKNAHPHFSTDHSFALAQNGIVENYSNLKKYLLDKGYQFNTETDTEVIVKLIEEELKSSPTLKEAVRKAFLRLQGRNTIIILNKKTNGILACRNGSPLIVGIDKNTGDTYISSDVLSFSQYVQQIHVMENNQMVEVNDKPRFFSLVSGQEQFYNLEPLTIESVKIDKDGYDHFMIKEINEAPFVIEQVINQDNEKFERLIKAIKNSGNNGNVYTIGSGTAGMAAAQIAYYLRVYGNIMVNNLVGGDARDYFDLFTPQDILIVPSQSGETADVLEVLEVAKSKGAKIACYVNMRGSAMTRISDFVFMSNAGPEICVMSTKIFVSQITWGYLLAKAVVGKIEEGKQNLKVLQDAVRNILQDKDILSKIKTVSLRLSSAKDIFLMGKSQNMQIMNEGMIKLIEGTYKHAHSIPAGDLKHYAITLMEEGVPVLAAISNDNVKSDLLNAVDQVRARGAKVIAIASEPNDLFDIFIQVPDLSETSAIVNVLVLQLLAYYLAVMLGNDVDHPRNIAKCVTVK